MTAAIRPATSAKSARAHAEARHLGDAQAQGAGGGEALLVGRRLVVADDVVVLEAAGDLGARAVADPHDDLVGLGVVDRRVARDVQPGVVQRHGERLGVARSPALVGVLEVRSSRRRP